MFRTFLVPAGLALAILTTMNVTSRASYVIRATPDNLVLVPAAYFHRDLSCEEARSFLEGQGYRVFENARCGHNYHIFRAERRGYEYIVHVMTERGQMMIDDRSR
jgi:hypothetical protein